MALLTASIKANWPDLAIYRVRLFAWCLAVACLTRRDRPRGRMRTGSPLAKDGFRFTAPRLVEMAPKVYVAQGYDFGDIAFVENREGSQGVSS